MYLIRITIVFLMKYFLKIFNHVNYRILLWMIALNRYGKKIYFLITADGCECIFITREDRREGVLQGEIALLQLIIRYYGFPKNIHDKYKFAFINLFNNCNQVWIPIYIIVVPPCSFIQLRWITSYFKNIIILHNYKLYLKNYANSE